MATPNVVESGNLSDFTVDSEESDEESKIEAEKALMELIDLDPDEPSDRAKIGLEKKVLLNTLRIAPQVCKKKYTFTKTALTEYPLVMLCRLGAPTNVLVAACKAHPSAIVSFVPNAVKNERVMCSFERLVGNGSVQGFLKAQYTTYGYTILHCATICGGSRELVVKLLHYCPALIEIKDKLGRLPIHVACTVRHDLIRFFAGSNYASLEEIDDEGCTPLHRAIQSNADKEDIQFLISAGPEALNIRCEKHGYTPFLFLCATMNAQMDVIELFVKDHPEVLKDKSTKMNVSPLHLAACLRQPLEIVKFLVDKMGKASLLEVSSRGLIPLQMACANKAPVEVAKFLLEQEPSGLMKRTPSSLDAFAFACRHHSSTLVEHMIEEHPEVLEQTYRRLTVLHICALQNNSLEQIKVLVARMGREALKVRDGGHGCIPLHYAVQEKKMGKNDPFHMINYLIKECPEATKIVNQSGAVPLDQATWLELTLYLQSKLVGESAGEERESKRPRIS